MFLFFFLLIFTLCTMQKIAPGERIHLLGTFFPNLPLILHFKKKIKRGRILQIISCIRIYRSSLDSCQQGPLCQGGEAVRGASGLRLARGGGSISLASAPFPLPPPLLIGRALHAPGAASFIRPCPVPSNEMAAARLGLLEAEPGIDVALVLSLSLENEGARSGSAPTALSHAVPAVSPAPSPHPPHGPPQPRPALGAWRGSHTHSVRMDRLVPETQAFWRRRQKERG